MRHVSRTHRVNIAWLKEEFDKDSVVMKFIQTQRQAADIFTKHFIDKFKWFGALVSVNHYPNFSNDWLTQGSPIDTNEPYIRDNVPYNHKQNAVHSMDGEDIKEFTLNKPSDYADVDKLTKQGNLNIMSTKKNNRRLKKSNTA